MLEAMDNDAGPAKPACTREDALAVLRRLREAGYTAYFAGGCVRDELLGLAPKDFDIATDAPPGRVRELFTHTEAVGAAFGVILVRHRRSVVEVATFRTEGAYLDGRRPESVRFSDAEHDAQRRDFTINGLFLDPTDGRVIDYVGGQADLAARRLRAIGNPTHRFHEDHLRLLRAVRFAARFDLTIDPATATAIRAHAPQLVRISPERIADELRRMLTVSSRKRAWTLLWEFALVDIVFRFLHSAEAAELEPRRSVFLQFAGQEQIPFGAALAAASTDYGWQAMPPEADPRPLFERRSVQGVVHACRRALKISNDESSLLEGALSELRPMLAAEPPRVAAMKRFLARPTVAWSREMLEALARVGVMPQRVEWLRGQLAELEQTEVAPPPLITGDDLVAAGYRPGPVFRRVLDEVYDAQLEGRVQNPAEAMNLAVALMAEGRW